MNVRIFWVHAMERLCTQTRPRFIVSSESCWRVESEPMLTPRKKSHLLEAQKRIRPTTPHQAGQRAKHTPTELFRPRHTLLKFHSWDISWSLQRLHQNVTGGWLNVAINFLVAVVNTLSTKTHSSKEIAEFSSENADAKSICYCKQTVKSKLSLSTECVETKLCKPCTFFTSYLHSLCGMVWYRTSRVKKKTECVWWVAKHC